MKEKIIKKKGENPLKPMNRPMDMGSLVKQFKNLDVYQKVVPLLSFIEIEHMIVDTSLGQRLRINVDISFHALTCAEVQLDAMDVAGDNQLNLEHDIVKQRLTSKGVAVGEPGIEVVGDREVNANPVPKDYCGPCYSSETETVKCCNTCEELKTMYLRKGWSLTQILRDSEQCLRDKTNPFAHVRAGEGCRVTGAMKVNKVSGNFHMAFGESVVRDGRHVHQYDPKLAPQFNVSHTIHSLSFGDPYPYMPPNPLDSVTRITDFQIGTGLFQYFVKVIPTLYTHEDGSKLVTNQYTVTERFKPFFAPHLTDLVEGDGNDEAVHVQAMSAAEQAGSVLPGMFIVYDISPFLIEVTKIRTPFYHLFSRLCAIVGGVFSILGVVDAVAYLMLKYTHKTA